LSASSRLIDLNGETNSLRSSATIVILLPDQMDEVFGTHRPNPVASRRIVALGLDENLGLMDNGPEAS